MPTEGTPNPLPFGVWDKFAGTHYYAAPLPTDSGGRVSPQMAEAHGVAGVGDMR